MRLGFALAALAVLTFAAVGCGASTESDDSASQTQQKPMIPGQNGAVEGDAGKAVVPEK